MTRDEKIYRCAEWVASVIIAAVLLMGFYKILYPADFALSVYRFHLLPNSMVNPAAIYLPWLEMVCAVCLFIPRWRKAALWIVLTLLLLFTVGIIINLLSGNNFSCGCFSRSPLAKPMSWMNVVRNAGLIALVVSALAARRKLRLQLERW